MKRGKSLSQTTTSRFGGAGEPDAVRGTGARPSNPRTHSPHGKDVVIAEREQRIASPKPERPSCAAGLRGDANGEGERSAGSVDEKRATVPSGLGA